MSQDHFDLADLPRIKASADFEAMLYGDALAEMQAPQANTPKRSTRIWLAMSMAASLAVGLWFGWGENVMLQDALSGLGVAPATLASDASEWNAYGDVLSEMSS